MNIKDVLSIQYGDWAALVCPRLGGNVISLTHCGKDVLVPLVDEEQLKVNPYLQGSPILFPANRTNFAKFNFEGKEYTLPLNEDWSQCHIHGFVHRRAFSLVEQKENEVTLKYVYDKIDEWFPFMCEIWVTYTLDDRGFTQSYTVKNIDERNLPVVFCMHSTFVEPELFILPISMHQERVDGRANGRYKHLNAQEQTYVTGSPSKGVDVDGYYLASGHKTVIGDYDYTVSDEFDHWVLYNGRGQGGFICIEPQCGMVNGLNEPAPKGHRVVAPNKSIDFSATISYNK